MGDFPSVVGQNRGVLSPLGMTMASDYAHMSNGSWSTITGNWTTNRAVYLPVLVVQPVVITQFAFVVNTQAGDVDCGLFSWDGRKRVSSGVTSCPAAGKAVVDVTDTEVPLGWHRMAFWGSTLSASFRNYNINTTIGRILGFTNQGIGGGLPNSITPATYSVAMAPLIVATYRTTAI